MNHIIIPAQVIEITQPCFDWCKKQFSIQQRNLEVNEMSFIIIVLTSLLLNMFIDNHSEFLIEHGIDESKLEKLHDATSLLSSVMLIMFIIYMVWFR